VTPTVAYSPVVVQPQTTIVRTGWYPGYLLDRLRLRRWSAADSTTVAAAPTYSVGYAPAYTAAYAPATYTANYAPYITAYAPLQTPVVQTSYYAAPAVVSAPACSNCPQTTTVSYAPSTVYRPVELAPVVQTVVAAPACEVPCSACSTGVSQAGYVEGAPADCPGCAATAGAPQYYEGSATPAPTPAGQPETPPPSLKPPVEAPANRTYGNEAEAAPSNQEKSVVPSPGTDDPEGPEADPEADPAATGNEDQSTSLDLQAPSLLKPQNDPMANRPTVDVHNAVYRQPARTATRVSTTAAKPAPPVDANGWYSVGR
jgi:hypothetical protein